jgi:peptidoglycan-associated lipoprotein
MKRIFLAASVAIVLSACGSAVKLDNAPVEDRSSTSSSAAAADTLKTNVAKTTVAPVETAKPSQDTALNATSRVVYFDYDSYVIKPEFQALIETHARFIKADKAKKVAIEGHTDERGGREYNLALGQKRAEVVRRALTLQGVADSQLEAVSFGKEKPAVPGNTEAAWEKNRRAEISYR